MSARSRKRHNAYVATMNRGYAGFAAAFPVDKAPCQVPVCDLTAVRTRDQGAAIQAAQDKRARRAAKRVRA